MSLLSEIWFMADVTRKYCRAHFHKHQKPFQIVSCDASLWKVLEYHKVFGICYEHYKQSRWLVLSDLFAGFCYLILMEIG